MNHTSLWAPWRMAYLEGLDAKADDAREAPAPTDQHFLQSYWEHPEHDETNHVIDRSDHGMVLLNRYPYANGHLLIALGEPRPTLLDYDASQRAAFWALVDRAMDLVHRTLHPQGVNIGVNEGRAAGAGVPHHLHAHVVPRWSGDTNFMSVVGDIRVIPDSLEAMAARYRATVAQRDAG